MEKTLHPSTLSGSDRFVKLRPLLQGEIRLIDFGASPGDPVLIHARIDDSNLPAYDALLHCWGLNHSLHEFELHGQILVVPHGLYLALLEFRSRCFTGKLWADALCIDQTNHAEKQIQIPLMGDIYSKARKVIAWLGNSMFGTRYKPSSVSEPSKKDAVSMSLLESMMKEILATKVSPLRGSAFWICFEYITQSPWFSRLWTFQEAILARHLCLWLGDWQVSWETLSALVSHVILVSESFTTIVPSFLPPAAALRSLSSIESLASFRNDFLSGKQDLIHLFSATRNKMCLESVDHVLALYNLTSIDFKQKVPVSVEPNPRELVIAATKALIHLNEYAYSWLALLSSKDRSRDLPSWVPDYASREIVRPLWRLHSSKEVRVSQGLRALNGEPWSNGPRTYVRTADNDSDSLTIDGVSAGWISRLLPPELVSESLNQIHLGEVMTVRKEWLYACVALVKCHWSSKVLWNIASLLMVERIQFPGGRASQDDLDNTQLRFAGAPATQDDPNSTELQLAGVPASQDDLDSTELQLASVPASQDRLDNTELILSMFHYLQEICSCFNKGVGTGNLRMPAHAASFCSFLVNRSFFVSDEGRLIGLAPHHARVGDEIIMPFGCQTPCIARKRSSGGTYELIGEAYELDMKTGSAFHTITSNPVGQSFTFD